MGIKSDPFTGVVLSGDDIAKFERQVEKTAAPKEAIATQTKGRQLASEMTAKGFVELSLGTRK